jgi:tripartite-type tricarboxylate transporter receptor subunit TctC
MNRKHMLPALACWAATLAASISPAQAQAPYPNKPVRIIVPSTPAGVLDNVARTLALRLAVLPDLPTVAESGYPGFESTAWVGLLAPAGTPKTIIEQLNAQVLKVMALPETRERMAGFGAEITTSTPDQFGAHIRSEIDKLGKVIRDARIKVD